MRYKIFMILILITICGCKTFKAPEGLESQPDECKDFYYVLEYYSVQGGDSAFVGTVYEKCLQARKEQKQSVIKKQSEKIKTLCEKLYDKDIEGFKKCIRDPP